jgi:hypothetical protein
VLTVVALLALAGCGQADTSGEAGPPAERRVEFGQTYTYGDGVSVAATRLTPFLHSDEAVGTKPGNDVRTTVTITNRGSKPLDVSQVDVQLRTGPAAVRASQIVDKANLLNDFAGTVPPGQSASTMYGFSYSSGDGGPASLQVTPSPGYEPVAFDGSVI